MVDATNVQSGNPWTRAANSNPILEFIDVVLRGSGQVIFMDNPLTGLLNFVAMFVGAYNGGTTYAVAIGSVIGTIASTAMAYLVNANRDNLKAGIYGFNGMLVGACLPTFLTVTPLMWAFVVIGSMFSTVVIIAVANFLAPYKMPAFTFPFVLVCWLIVLFAKNTGDAGLVYPAAGPLPEGEFNIIKAGLNSVSQVWFVADWMAGIIFLVALAVESLWCFGLTALGAFLGAAFAYFCGASADAVNFGLWGFTAALTAPAVGCVFMKAGPKTFIYAVLSIFVTVVIHGAMREVCGAWGIPTFTFPFNLAGWLFLLPLFKFWPEEAAS